VTGPWLFAQTIDKTLYQETTLFDLEIWERQSQANTSQRFKATIQFMLRSGSDLYFKDPDSNITKVFTIIKTWPDMQREQHVTVYFTARKSYGSPDSRIIDDIDYDNISPVAETDHPFRIEGSLIDHSQYTETTLFNLEIWERQGQASASQRFRATIQFISQSGVDLYFRDIDGNTIKGFHVLKRWPGLRRNQRVTVYFTAKKSYGRSESRIIDDIKY